MDKYGYIYISSNVYHNFISSYPCFILQFFLKLHKTHPAEWIPRWLPSDFAKGLSQNMFPPCCGLRWGLQVSCPVKMLEGFGPQQDNIPRTSSDDYMYIHFISIIRYIPHINKFFPPISWPNIIEMAIDINGACVAHKDDMDDPWQFAAWPSLLPALIIACRRRKIWRCVMFKLCFAWQISMQCTPENQHGYPNDGLANVESFKIWPFLVSMLDFWGVYIYIYTYIHTHTAQRRYINMYKNMYIVRLYVHINIYICWVYPCPTMPGIFVKIDYGTAKNEQMMIWLWVDGQRYNQCDT